MTQMLQLVDKDFKAGITHILKKFHENTYTMNEQMGTWVSKFKNDDKWMK